MQDNSTIPTTKRKRGSSAAVLVLIVAVLIVSGFFLFRKGGPLGKQARVDSVIVVEPEINSYTVHTEVAGKPQQPGKITVQKDTPVLVVLTDGDQAADEKEKNQQAIKVRKTQQSTNTASVPTNSTGTDYKVINVAYFYNEPDEQTRRKAFINHWNNSYASIKPTDERNGFIYVVFQNHLGQVSKGWLRKQDLQAVK